MRKLIIWWKMNNDKVGLFLLLVLVAFFLLYMGFESNYPGEGLEQMADFFGITN